MATMPAFPRTSGPIRGADDRTLSSVPPSVNARRKRDPFRLRPLPQEDVFFFCKKIDNSRLDREPDPKARGVAWSTIGAACVAVVALAAATFPALSSTLAGYKLEALRAEQRRLVEERRTLEFEEAIVLSPDRVRALAQKHNLAPPSDGQVMHLDGNDDAVAMVK
jgi:hypothetical protein